MSWDSRSGSRGSYHSCNVTPCLVLSHPWSGWKNRQVQIPYHHRPTNTPNYLQSIRQSWAKLINNNVKCGSNERKAVVHESCSTCFVLLVAAAPTIPFVDPWVVAAHSVSIVAAGFPESRQPLIQFVHTL